MRFGVWAAEFGRHLDRLHEVKKRIMVGKMSGAVEYHGIFRWEMPRITGQSNGNPWHWTGLITNQFSSGTATRKL